MKVTIELKNPIYDLSKDLEKVTELDYLIIVFENVIEISGFQGKLVCITMDKGGSHYIDVDNIKQIFTKDGS